MSGRFLRERERDPYYRAAQREGLRSRAAFKLTHLAQRYPILSRGARVLDLGAAPGGWSVVALGIIGPKGVVVAVDQRPVDPAPGLVYVRGRVGDPSLIERLGPERFDTVLSDLSPQISGAYATDHARSVELVRAAATLAHEVLVHRGSFVAKMFDGDLWPQLESEIAPWFQRVVRTKPPASRSQSSEIYVIGLGHRPKRAPREAVDPGGPGSPRPDI